MTELGGHVSWCLIDDVVFILDTLTGNYYGLGPEQVRVWLTLFSKQVPGSASAGHPLGQGELDALLSLLQANGWLQEGSGPRPRRPGRPGLAGRLSPAIHAFYCLARTALTLRWRGFHAVYSWAERSSAASSPGQGGTGTALQFAVAMEHFHRAEQFWMSRGAARDCLPRSLALFVYLRGWGLPAKHVIGVKRFPFAAHAWAEFEAKPLLAARQHGPTRNTGTTVNGDLESEFVPIAELG